MGVLSSSGVFGAFQARRVSRWRRPGARRFRAGAEALEGRQLLAVAIGEITFSDAPTWPFVQSLTKGPDGNIWYTALDLNSAEPGRVGRVAPDGTITVFNVPGNGRPSGITAGPDGNLWFVDNARAFSDVPAGTPVSDSFVGRITPAGVITEFPLPRAIFAMDAITSGPDGNLWFTSVNGINRFTTDGVVTTFAVPSHGQARGITAGPDGNLWFTETETAGKLVGRITPSGEVTEFDVPAATPGFFGSGITAGPDGNIWFLIGNTLPQSGRLERITPSGAITDYALPGLGRAIAGGDDGALWIAESPDEILRFALDGTVSEYPVPTPQSQPNWIAAGPDGTLWFTEQNYQHLGRVFPDRPVDGSLTATAPPALGVTETHPFDGTVATFTDARAGANAADFVTRIDWGDGTSTVGTVAPDGSGGFVVRGQHTYFDEGSFPVVVTVFDTTIDAPREATARSVFNVADAPLQPVSVESLAFRGQLNPILVAIANAVDPTATYTATIDWGDGSTSAGTIEILPPLIIDPLGPPGPAQVATTAIRQDATAIRLGTQLNVYGNHVYSTDGWYVVKTHIRDEAGLETTVISQVHYVAPTIYDKHTINVRAVAGVPTGGFNLGFFYTTAPNLAVDQFSATVDWGDGTAPSAATVTYGGPFTFGVHGSHVYRKPGDYVFHVTINGLGAPVVMAGSAEVTADATAPPPALNGHLDRASDSGISSIDGITSNARPTFLGVAEPGAVVRLYAWPGGAGTPFLIGQTAADSQGRWSVVSKTLPDGTYAISAHELAADGRRTSTRVNIAAVRRLVVDTVGPRITHLSLDPGAGVIAIEYSDRNGMDQRGMRMASRYALQQITGSAAVRIATSASLRTARSVTVGLPGPLADGRYLLRVVSAGILDLAGNPLDGEFRGTFATGDGQRGGDFVGLFNVSGQRTVAPVPFAPSSQASANVALAISHTPAGPLASASVARRRH